jgi:hypothetical protein
MACWPTTTLWSRTRMAMAICYGYMLWLSCYVVWYCSVSLLAAYVTTKSRPYRHSIRMLTIRNCLSEVGMYKYVRHHWNHSFLIIISPCCVDWLSAMRQRSQIMSIIFSDAFHMSYLRLPLFHAILLSTL